MESTAILPLPGHPEVLLPHFQNLLQRVLSTHPPDLWFSFYSYWEDPELFCNRHPWHWSLPVRVSFQTQLWSWYTLRHHQPFVKLKGRRMPLFQPLDKTWPQLSTSSCFVNSYSCLTKVTFYLHPEQPKWPTQWFPCSPPLPLHSHNSLNLEYPTILMRRTAGSYGKIMLHCFRKCQTVFQRGCTIVHSHHNVVGFQSLHILTFCCLFFLLLKQVWRGISLWFWFFFSLMTYDVKSIFPNAYWPLFSTQDTEK